jgi:uncharacterized protein (TIGR03437 family)
VNASDGTFRAIDAAVNSAAPNRASYLAAIDRAIGKVNGVLPSTFLNDQAVTFQSGPDGTFWGAYLFGGGDHLPNGTNASASPIVTAAQTVAFRTKYFVRKGEYFQYLQGWAKYVVYDASGRVMDTGVDEVNPQAPLNFALQATIKWMSFPEGGYRVETCVVNAPSISCVPGLTDTAYFAVYRKEWYKGRKVFIFANGGPNGYFDLNSTAKLSVVSGATSIEVYPGLLVANDVARDLVVTDGTKTRAFTSDQDAPVFEPWTRRDQPYVYRVTNPATFAEGRVVSGSYATIFTWGATHNDPAIATTSAFPSSGCEGSQGKTRVVFVGEGGISADAVIQYCSFGQLNIQVPDLPLGTAKVKVILNNTESNSVEVQVEKTDPAIFLVNAAEELGAVIHPNGTLVTEDNPTSPGEIIAVFATGLGQSMPQVPFGKAAPNYALSYTVYPVTAQVKTRSPSATSGRDASVLFAGLAPGFVGLYQVNVQLPADLEPGVQTLKLIAEGKESNAVKLPVR